MKWKLILLSLLLVCLIVGNVSAVTIEEIADGDDEVVFWPSGTKANFTMADKSMDFTRIDIGHYGLRLNDIWMNITSANNINISVSYLNSNILTATNGDTLLTFNADTSSGKVWFNLSGFQASRMYSVYRDGTIITTANSTAGGVFSFSNTVWSDHDFQIVMGDQTGDREIRIRYNSEATEDVEDVGFSTFPLMALVAVVMVAVAIMIMVSRR